MSDRAMMTINEFTDWGCVSRTRTYELRGPSPSWTRVTVHENVGVGVGVGATAARARIKISTA
ncbi:hypothetical protein C8J40_105355 [Sphingomonas sp. PP-CC-3A-396]|nr:hypothetical protein C8J40_105355 [Sphingomonas sp. PP-CC-3A-396]